MQQEWIYGRQAVYEVLRTQRRKIYRLRQVRPNEKSISTEDNPSQTHGRIADILSLCLKYKIPVEQVSRSQLDNLSHGNQGVALEVSPYPYVDLWDILISERAESSSHPFILILDILQDPQNFGTLLRTAEAVGIQGVILPLRHSVTVTPAVVNASAGASEHLQIIQSNLAQTIEKLKAEDIWIVGLDAAEDAQSLGDIDLNRPLALVVGSEGQGLRPLVRSSCDLILRLPMCGKISSLNAATAGSVALYFAWQARRFT